MLSENTLNAMLDNTVISTHDYKMVVFPVMEVRHGCCSRSTGMATDYINNVLNSSYRQTFDVMVYKSSYYIHYSKESTSWS